jgi:L-alanine-DL-glutamate epimerase-like enolase superfamily enzyme
MCIFFWLEDVTVHDDYSGLARVADALATPLGERRVFVRHHAVSPYDRSALRPTIIMIDLIRVGGISNWMKVAALAEAIQSSRGESPAAGDSRPI